MGPHAKIKSRKTSTSDPPSIKLKTTKSNVHHNVTCTNALVCTQDVLIHNIKYETNSYLKQEKQLVKEKYTPYLLMI